MSKKEEIHRKKPSILGGSMLSFWGGVDCGNVPSNGCVFCMSV